LGPWDTAFKAFALIIELVKVTGDLELISYFLESRCGVCVGWGVGVEVGHVCFGHDYRGWLAPCFLDPRIRG